MTIKELNNMLALKLQNEFSKYTQDLINNKTSQEIVMKSYETTVKEGYIDLFSYKDLEKDEIKALLKEENILDSLYDDWIKSDGCLWEQIENVADISVERIKDNYHKEQRKQRER
ncbi:MAG: DUF3848 domain-containing protein [Clostridia bacterium]|nr:DUF3848 domain-containing protein [Clostridia bacterium]